MPQFMQKLLILPCIVHDVVVKAGVSTVKLGVYKEEENFLILKDFTDSGDIRNTSTQPIGVVDQDSIEWGISTLDNLNKRL